VVLVLIVHQKSTTYVGSIIRDCINFNVCFCNLIFLHGRREANQIVYYLAKYPLYNLDCIYGSKKPRHIFLQYWHLIYCLTSLMKLSLM